MASGVVAWGLFNRDRMMKVNSSRRNHRTQSLRVFGGTKQLTVIIEAPFT